MFSFFQDHEITETFEHHAQGTQPSRSGCYAAVNMVCACASLTTEGARNIAPEQLFQNALRVLPKVVTESPGTISVGALLLMVCQSNQQSAVEANISFQVTYLVATSRSSTASIILGSAIQMILLAGYHMTISGPGHKSAQDLQKSRLLYRAYILEQDLSVRLGKPPILSESLITYLPNERPDDCQGIICLPEGTTVNYLRERVALARIQNRAWEALRSPLSSTKSSQEFLESTNKLLEELQEWNESLPASIKPPELPAKLGDLQQMQVKDLHWSYFQTVVAIHSAIFSHVSLFSDPAVRDQAAIAVDECAGVVREMITLAKHLDQEYPLVP